MNIERSPYDRNIAAILNISLDYFYTIHDRLNDSDWENLYFYSGRYISKPNDVDKKLLDNLIEKYKRTEKLKKILDECD